MVAHAHIVPLTPPVRDRHSPRAFDPRPVPAELLRSLFEAARWAPSSRNEQPWRFILVTQDDRVAFDALVATLNPANAVWASHAPALVVTVARRTLDNGTPNRFALHDVGMATQNLMLQASSLGLVTHPMGGFDGGRVREHFAILDEFEPVAVLVVGYPGSIDALPEALREREHLPRTRRDLNQLVFGATWGEAAPEIAATAEES